DLGPGIALLVLAADLLERVGQRRRRRDGDLAPGRGGRGNGGRGWSPAGRGGRGREGGQGGARGGAGEAGCPSRRANERTSARPRAAPAGPGLDQAVRCPLQTTCSSSSQEIVP